MQYELLYSDTFEGAAMIGGRRLFRIMYTETGQTLQEYHFTLRKWHKDFELNPEEVQALHLSLGKIALATSH